MSQIHYVKVEGKFLPINIQPAGIKCFTCGDQCPADQLQSHLTSHVDPAYYQSSKKRQPKDQQMVGKGLPPATHPSQMKLSKMKQSHPSKVNLSNLLAYNVDDTDLSVKSFQVEKVPKNQSKKKKSIIPHGDKKIIPNDFDLNDPMMNSSTEEDLHSECVENYQYPQTFQQHNLQYLSRVKLTSQRCRVDKKEIKLFQNEKNISTNEDHGGSSSRQRAVEEKSKKQYKITKIVQHEETDASSSEASLNVYNVSTQRKNPVQSLKFSTSLSQHHPNKNNKDQSKTMHTTLVPHSTYKDKKNDTQSEFSDHDHHYELICRSCKGFYCRECKSTIPAIYRPVPDENGKYHIHPEAKAMNFYRKHYYSKKDDICTGCQKLQLPE